MKKLALALALVAVVGCPKAGANPSGPMPGAPDPRRAVENFLAAVRAQDLQALSVAWGNSSGPTRDAFDRDQLEKRELIMMCYFSHDSFRIVSDAPGEEGRRVFRVEMSKGTQTRETNFTTVRGPSARWYVEVADMVPVRDFCEKRG